MEMETKTNKYFMGEAIEGSDDPNMKLYKRREREREREILKL